MANIQKPEHSEEKPEKSKIPEPTGDGFPAEKDVSDPPPGSDADTSREDVDKFDEKTD